jgi:hypothetical protein
LYRKGGQESLLSYLGHVVMENRNGLVIKAQVSTATGTTERDSAVEMIREISRSGRITVGADKAYDTKQFVADLRGLKATPHVAQNICRNRTSAIDRRTVAHPGYSVSQKKRKRVEEVFGWMKTVGMDVHIGGCNVQHGPDAKSDGRRTHLTREGDEDFDPASPKAGNIETLIKTDFLLIHARGMEFARNPRFFRSLIGLSVNTGASIRRSLFFPTS